MQSKQNRLVIVFKVNITTQYNVTYIVHYVHLCTLVAA